MEALSPGMVSLFVERHGRRRAFLVGAFRLRFFVRALRRPPLGCGFHGLYDFGLRVITPNLKIITAPLP